MEMQGNGVKCQKVQISISQRDVKESKEHVSKQGFRCFGVFWCVAGGTAARTASWSFSMPSAAYTCS